MNAIREALQLQQELFLNNPVSLHPHVRRSGHSGKSRTFDDCADGSERADVQGSHVGLLRFTIRRATPIPNSVGNRLRCDGVAADSDRPLRSTFLHRATTEPRDRIAIGDGSATWRCPSAGSETWNGVGGNWIGSRSGHLGLPYAVHRDLTLRCAAYRCDDVYRCVDIAVGSRPHREHSASLSRGAK